MSGPPALPEYKAPAAPIWTSKPVRFVWLALVMRPDPNVHAPTTRSHEPAVSSELHKESREALSPRRRVSITRAAGQAATGLARAQLPPQHAHMIHPYGNPAFARPSTMH